MPLFEVTLEVAQGDAEEASALLFEHGVQAVEIRDHQGLVLPNVTLPPTDRAWLICGFEAQSSEELRSFLNTELNLFPYPYQLHSLQPRDDIDWALQWKKFYHPLKISERLWVVPSWEIPPAIADALCIRLDPEMAFGTGQHATTQLCLRALEKVLVKDAEKKHILDVGTGSGILAIAAGLLGATHITGCDNDAVSVATAQKNAEQNHVAATFSLLELPQQASQLVGPFDVVIANILSEPLISMASTLVALLASPATIILSGLLISQADAVKNAYLACGLKFAEQLQQDEWVALQLTT